MLKDGLPEMICSFRDTFKFTFDRNSCVNARSFGKCWHEYQREKGKDQNVEPHRVIRAKRVMLIVLKLFEFDYVKTSNHEMKHTRLSTKKEFL